MTGLTGFALAAVRGAEHHVTARVADGVARPPESIRDPGVRRVLEQPTLLAALDLVGDLGRELEIEPAVIDRPRSVRGQVQAVVGVGDDVVEAHPRARQQIDVGHPDQRDAVPTVRAHRTAARAPDAWRSLAARE